MEPRPNSSQNLTPPTGERWYLRVQGRILGPLEASEVKQGLKTGEFLLSDKVTSSRNPSWFALSDHPLFRPGAEDAIKLGSKALVPPPPPQLLRIKPPIPAVPVPAAIPVPPPAPVVAKVEIPPEPVLVASVPLAAKPAKPVKKISKPAIPKKFTEPPPERIPVIPPTLLADLPPASPPPLEPEMFADIETNASLDEATKELERFLMSVKKPEPPKEKIAPPAGRSEIPVAAKAIPKVEITAPIPERPRYEPVFVSPPETERRPEKKPLDSREEKTNARVIRIELSLPTRPWRLLAWLSTMAVILFLLFSYGISQWSGSGSGENKTRDLKDSRLSDPSSPTNQPPEAGDPVPPLKAPTRPQRE